jgi:hypothetical protein
MGSRDGVVREVFGNEIDYASEIKVFKSESQNGIWHVFTKPVVVAIKRKARIHDNQ